MVVRKDKMCKCSIIEIKNNEALVLFLSFNSIKYSKLYQKYFFKLTVI